MSARLHSADVTNKALPEHSVFVANVSKWDTAAARVTSAMGQLRGQRLRTARIVTFERSQASVPRD
jgi:hypothetical protein